MNSSVLIIGGEPSERAILCNAIREKLAYETPELSYEADASNLLPLENISNYKLILFDISRLSTPAERVARIRAIAPNIPLIVLTRYGDYEGATASINAGAMDFLTKPVAIERIAVTFQNALQLHELQSGSGKLPQHNNHNFSLFSDDGNIRRIYELEKEAIQRAVQYYDGRMSEVARRLGIGRSTLYRKLNSGRDTEAQKVVA